MLCVLQVIKMITLLSYTRVLKHILRTNYLPIFDTQIEIDVFVYTEVKLTLHFDDVHIKLTQNNFGTQLIRICAYT